MAIFVNGAVVTGTGMYEYSHEITSTATSMASGHAVQATSIKNVVCEIGTNCERRGWLLWCGLGNTDFPLRRNFAERSDAVIVCRAKHRSTKR